MESWLAPSQSADQKPLTEIWD